MFDADQQGWARHERNKRMGSSLVRLLRKPYIWAPLGAFVCFVVSQSGIAAHTGTEALAMSLAGLFSMVCLGVILIGPFVLIFKGSKRATERFIASRRLAVPHNLPNASSLQFIQDNYKQVFANIGLALHDDEKTARMQAGAAAAALYGKSRVARVGSTAALAADAFSQKQVPRLVEVSPHDEYRSDLFFQCPPGVTVQAFDTLSDEIASGFRVPRVAASQGSEHRAMGIVCLSVFHRDVLEESHSFEDDSDVEGWFEDE